MNATHELGDPAELANLYLTGDMTDAQQADYEAHLPACAHCREELARLGPLVERLVACIRPLEPDPAIRETLLARIESGGPAAVDRTIEISADGGELYVLRATEGAWEETPYAGVTLRRLFVDRRRRQFTALVRLRPGAIFPEHRHAEAEECLVLEGDLRIGDLELRAGDFQRTPPGFVQAEQTTLGGCLLLLTLPFD